MIKLKPCIPNNSIDVINACSPYTWIDGNTYTNNDFSTTYTLSNADGCDSIVTLNLTLTNLDTNVQAINNTLISNATGVTYQWVECSNNNFLPIAGATNQTYLPVTNSSYAVIISNGICTDTSICLPFAVTSLEMNNKVPLSLNPNPTDDKTSILLPEFEDEVIIDVISIEGVIVQTLKLYLVKEISISLQNYSSGIYYIKYKSNKKQQVFKILKY